MDLVNIDEARRRAQRQLHKPGIVAGLDIGQRRDSCALIVAHHGTRRREGVTEHAWRIGDAWTAPLGTRSSDAAPMIRDRLAGFGVDEIQLVVDATGAGDAWLDHLVAVGVIPTLAVVVAGPGITERWSVDRIGGVHVARVTAPRHPGGNGNTVSLLGALETALSVQPGEERPSVTVDPFTATSETGMVLRRQLAALTWRNGRPDHESGGHDDLAFALALVVWASRSAREPLRSRARVTSTARRSLAPQISVDYRTTNLIRFRR